MVIAIPTLVLIVLAFALPNYLAVRYAVFGGAPGAPAAAPGTTPAVRRKNQAWLKFTRRGYLWKALSPFVFAACVILGLGLGGAVGISLVAVATLNLAWGLIGWDGYVPGRR
ncbi:MAG TPA: hypothetical protein VNT01_07600 [Symbiobacteriaceae bacterium]|nr:hypothetical protein [Symbiobacteriaceae bacterium]